MFMANNKEQGKEIFTFPETKKSKIIDEFGGNGEFFGGIENRDKEFNIAFSENGGPGFTSPLINSLRGIKILGQGPQMAPYADDTIGLVFANRPLLNLSDDNVSRHPRLATLFQAANNSFPNYVRGLLDPVLGRANPHPGLDPYNPWIVPFTNYLKQSGGFPDLDMDIETTQPGIRQEVYQFVNSILEENGKFTINQTYYNPKPGIIPYLLQVWLTYISEISCGDHGLSPYWEALYQNYRDFDTRIYHFIMEKNTRFISSCYMGVESIPVTFPIGAFATIDNETSSRRGQGQDDITVQYSTVGLCFTPFEIVDSFNGVTEFFNPNMADAKREGTYRKLKPSEYIPNNYGVNKRVYPWVNLNTMEMEWWVTK